MSRRLLNPMVSRLNLNVPRYIAKTIIFIISGEMDITSSEKLGEGVTELHSKYPTLYLGQKC